MFQGEERLSPSPAHKPHFPAIELGYPKPTSSIIHQIARLPEIPQANQVLPPGVKDTELQSRKQPASQAKAKGNPPRDGYKYSRPPRCGIAKYVYSTNGP